MLLVCSENVCIPCSFSLVQHNCIYKHIDVLFESGRFFRADDMTVCDVTVSGRVSVRPHEFGTCCLRGVPIG